MTQTDNIASVYDPTFSPEQIAEADALRADRLSSTELDQAYESAVSGIIRVLRSGRGCSVSFSSGKDSATVLCLLMEAARRMVESGESVPPIRVFTSNTLVENPEIIRFVQKAKADTEAYAQGLGIDFEFMIASPRSYEHYLVRVLSGRCLPAMPHTNGNCSDWLKITPLTRLQRDFSKALKTRGFYAPVVLTGSRRSDESARRTRNMAIRGESGENLSYKINDQWHQAPNDGKASTAAAFNDFRTTYTLAPVADWSTTDIFRFLSQAGQGEKYRYPAYQADFSALLDYYADSSTGACVLVEDPTTKARTSGGCDSRSGCVTCWKIGPRDKGAEQLAQHPQYAYFKPLTAWRNYVARRTVDYTSRNWLGRNFEAKVGDGVLGVFPNTLHPDEAEQMLRMALTIDMREKERAAARKVAMAKQAQEKNALYKTMGLGEWKDPWPHLNEPQFQLLGLREIVMIAFCSAREAYGRAGWALQAWRDIVVNGVRVETPEVNTDEIKCPPPVIKRYVAVDQRAFVTSFGLRDEVMSAVCSDSDGSFPVEDGVIDFTSDESLAWWISMEMPELLAQEHLTNAALTRRMLQFGLISLDTRAMNDTDYKVRLHQAKEFSGLPASLRHDEVDLIPSVELASVAPFLWQADEMQEASAQDRFVDAYRGLFDVEVRLSAGLAVDSGDLRSARSRFSMLARDVPDHVLEDVARDARERVMDVRSSLVDGRDPETVAVSRLGTEAMFAVRRIDWDALIMADRLGLHEILAGEQLALFAS